MSLRNALGFSKFWDIYLPIGISSIPPGCFKLIRVAADWLDQPGAGIAPWLMAAVLALQTAGIIGMAVVILLRIEIGMKQLRVACGETPILWRRLGMLMSMVLLAMFDIFLNVGVAFADAFPLIAVSGAFYLLYLLGIRLTFCCLPEHHSSIS